MGCVGNGAMKLIWVFMVVVIAAINFYYVNAFYAIAEELHQLRVATQAKAPLTDPIDQLKNDVGSAWMSIQSALKGTA